MPFVVDGTDCLEEVRTLLREYAETLDIDLSFQAFESELAELPGRYEPPTGRLLLALEDGESAGCVALRKLDQETCEMKRLYVRPAFRGRRIGKALAEAAISQARSIGYVKIYLDTLESMSEARSLYVTLGFRETHAYTYNPVPGATFMELVLRE